MSYSNRGSQPVGLNESSTEQDWLNGFNPINFEDSCDATTTRREQICYTVKDSDAKKQPVVSRGAGSRVTEDLNSASSKSHSCYFRQDY